MKKILVIEDDADLCANIKQIFEINNYKVFLAYNGADGISTAKNKNPDIILCDIGMPGMDGYEVKNSLGKDTKTISIPFVFLSGKAELKDIKYGLGLGADDYVVKPFTIDDLFNTIEYRLNRIKAFSSKPQLKNKTGNKNHKRLSAHEQILVYIKGEPEIIKLDDIIVINSKGDYTTVFCTNGKTLTVRKLLKEWETILPEKLFFRARKTSIINVNFIIKLDKWYSRTMMVKLKGYNNPVIISQRMCTKLKSVIGF